MRALKGLALVLVVLVAACAEPEATAPDASEVGPAFAKGPKLTPKEDLGKAIYFDENLSLNRNQACATCHHPKAGFAAPNGDDSFNKTGGVIEGSVPGRFGNRKPPTAAYAAVSPVFHFDGELFVGGNFWDGRATGEGLGNPAADQALGPFLNSVEQALPDNACVVYRVCNGDKKHYDVRMEDVWGPEVCAIDWPPRTDKLCEKEGTTIALSGADRDKVDNAYDMIGLSIAEFELSSQVNQFSSKFDAYMAGADVFSEQEKLGLALFLDDEVGGAKCALCHILVEDDPQNLFTDFTFDNLGIPPNPENPATATGFIDYGLGDFLRTRTEWAGMAAANDGKHKVPTLRNLNQRPKPGYVRAYGHNGYFKSIEGIVHFYNTRDVKGTCSGPYTEAQARLANCWPAPEVAANVNTGELGDLGLTAAEEAALVAFLKTLDDGYVQ